jgi:hypothetical protein
VLKLGSYGNSAVILDSGEEMGWKIFLRLWVGDRTAGMAMSGSDCACVFSGRGYCCYGMSGAEEGCGLTGEVSLVREILLSLRKALSMLDGNGSNVKNGSISSKLVEAALGKTQRDQVVLETVLMGEGLQVGHVGRSSLSFCLWLISVFFELVLRAFLG